jgi:hypothetical protein
MTKGELYGDLPDLIEQMCKITFKWSTHHANILFGIVQVEILILILIKLL